MGMLFALDHSLLCCACTMLMRCDAMLSLQCSIYACSVLARSLYNLSPVFAKRDRWNASNITEENGSKTLYNPKVQYTTQPPNRTPNPKKLAWAFDPALYGFNVMCPSSSSGM